jgi:hypothetical protein
MQVMQAVPVIQAPVIIMDAEEVQVQVVQDLQVLH